MFFSRPEDKMAICAHVNDSVSRTRVEWHPKTPHPILYHIRPFQHYLMLRSHSPPLRLEILSQMLPFFHQQPLPAPQFVQSQFTPPTQAIPPFFGPFSQFPPHSFAFPYPPSTPASTLPQETTTGKRKRGQGTAGPSRKRQKRVQPAADSECTAAEICGAGPSGLPSASAVNLTPPGGSQTVADAPAPSCPNNSNISEVS
ncbi:hypothetical protein BXZ70DRAFT_557351 [Cristinia sonorae]|uniref:Uncharacterized protein n=1 Tax=Cristinia sonorae TaxID=1940300 RepID=A0A8K0UFR5_9AGAR|nr:hypothetical protein BXZ70DRAFT_557351 [Cristinia sonorae]